MPLRSAAFITLSSACIVRTTCVLLRARRISSPASRPFKSGIDEIEQGDIRLELARQTHGLLAVDGFAHHFEVGALEDRAKALTDDPVVVGDEDPHCHLRSPAE